MIIQETNVDEPPATEDLTSRYNTLLTQDLTPGTLNRSVCVENQIHSLIQKDIESSETVIAKGGDSCTHEQMSGLIKTAGQDIKLYQYQIQKMMDTGNFHKVLMPGQREELQITADIPLCCKVDLKNQEMPVKVTVSKVKSGQKLAVYTSFEHSEPTQSNCDGKFFNQTCITVQERSSESESKERFKAK